MNLSWHERSGLEKAIFVIQCVGAAALVLWLVLPVFVKIELPDLIYLFIGLVSALEAVVQWNRNPLTAKLEAVAAVSALLVFVVSLL